MLYTALYMPSTRTQIYLTAEQRRKLDVKRKRERRTLADLVREAVDAYLGNEEPGAIDAAFDAAFGSSPGLEVPAREEWDRRLERVYAKRRDG